MPRTNRRSKSADSRATRKAGASRTRRYLRRREAEKSEKAESEKPQSLAARIRALDGTMRRCDIARTLGTSTAYVRVVLNHRTETGGMSKYDLAYDEKHGCRKRSGRNAYFAVDPEERRAIRKSAIDTVTAQGFNSHDGEVKAFTLATSMIRKRGRQLLAEARGDTG